MLRSLYQGSLYRGFTKKCTKCPVAGFFLSFKSIILVALSPVADPDLQIRGGGGGRARSSKP